MEGGLGIAVHHPQEGALLTAAQSAMIGAGGVAEGGTGAGDVVVVEIAPPQAVVQGPMAALLARPLHGVATGRAQGATAGVVAGQAGVTLQQKVQVLVWEQV